MRIIIYFIVFGVGFLSGIMFASLDFIQIDSCLDRGGNWNKEQKYCEYRKEK